MKIAIIIGTRPEIIKMSPIIRLCEQKDINYFILHTGQHYSHNLDKIFFNELELPEPKYNLSVGSGTHSEEIGQMLIGIEKILINEKPDIVMVQGDTNTVFAGALVASRLHIKVAHIEAGLRSYDKTMPEEINRILTDHISDYLFPPTEETKNNLVTENIREEIYVVGNTIVDAVFENLNISQKKTVLKDLGLNSEYFLITLHRQENVDIKEKISVILEALDIVHNRYGIEIIFPIHPRTKKKIKEFDLKPPKGLRFIEPLGFLEFLQLEANAKLVLTDSGGVQEETCILGVPCITLRENTERPETLEVGSNILAGTDTERILDCIRIMLNKDKKWKNPFGDGKAGERIMNIIYHLK